MGAMKRLVVDALEMHNEGCSILYIAGTLGITPNEVGMMILNFDEDPNYPDNVQEPNYSGCEQEFDDIPF